MNVSPFPELMNHLFVNIVCMTQNWRAEVSYIFIAGDEIVSYKLNEKLIEQLRFDRDRNQTKNYAQGWVRSLNTDCYKH